MKMDQRNLEMHENYYSNVYQHYIHDHNLSLIALKHDLFICETYISTSRAVENLL